MAKVVKFEPPSNWEKTVDNIRLVREKYPAPVDSMGCDQANTRTDKDCDQRFQILTSLMLSSQTKDPITWAAVQRLKEAGLGNVQGIMNAQEKDIETLIYPVGFYRRKAIYLKKVSKILNDQYNGDIPDTIKDLCDLPGVGPKMAHLCMREAWDLTTGIGVDTHVHRISARLDWVPKTGIKSPEDTRKALESWLPRTYWGEINHLLVGFGQTICTPLRPKCDECYNKPICPYPSSQINEKTTSSSKTSKGQVTIHKTSSKKSTVINYGSAKEKPERTRATDKMGKRLSKKELKERTPVSTNEDSEVESSVSREKVKEESFTVKLELQDTEIDSTLQNKRARKATTTAENLMNSPKKQQKKRKSVSKVPNDEQNQSHLMKDPKDETPIVAMELHGLDEELMKKTSASTKGEFETEPIHSKKRARKATPTDKIGHGTANATKRNSVSNIDEGEVGPTGLMKKHKRVAVTHKIKGHIVNQNVSSRVLRKRPTASIEEVQSSDSETTCPSTIAKVDVHSISAKVEA